MQRTSHKMHHRMMCSRSARAWCWQASLLSTQPPFSSCLQRPRDLLLRAPGDNRWRVRCDSCSTGRDARRPEDTRGHAFITKFQICDECTFPQSSHIETGGTPKVQGCGTMDFSRVAKTGPKGDMCLWKSHVGNGLRKPSASEVAKTGSNPSHTPHVKPLRPEPLMLART